MKKIYGFVAAVTAVLLFPIQSQAVVINFDDLAENTIITDQYAEATFSSLTDGRDIRANYFYDIGQSLPNMMCSQPIGGLGHCVGDIAIDFTDAVNNLTFLSVGDNSDGITALVDIFVNNSFSATFNIVTDGITSVTDLHDLSAFSNITRIVIREQTDPAGLGFDDFTFDVASVPEPATLVLMSMGLAGIGFSRHRKSA